LLSLAESPYYVWTNSEGLREQVAVPSSSMPMIDDPEEERSEWDDPIVARDPEEAERECRARAARDGVELVRVQNPSKIRRGQDQAYRCWFK
jgi:hypothetical protein